MNHTYQIASNNDYWQVSWRDADGVRHRRSLGAKANMTRRQATAEMQKIIADHVSIPATALCRRDSTMSEWCERYLTVRQRELAASTLRSHRLTASLLCKAFPNKKISTISQAEATDWRISLQVGTNESPTILDEATVCKHVREAKVILDRAVVEGSASHHNFAHLKGTAPRKQVFDRQSISLELVERVVAHAGVANNAAALVILGYFTGMRAAEIQALRWEHIDLTRNRITVVPREGKVTTKQRLRELRIEPELWTWLVDRRTTQQDEGLVISGCSNPARDVRQACIAAGVEPFTLQQLRQTRDTIWHDRLPAHVACAWIGHSEATARKHYLSVPEDAYTYGDDEC
jgi:integrase